MRRINTLDTETTLFREEISKLCCTLSNKMDKECLMTMTTTMLVNLMSLINLVKSFKMQKSINKGYKQVSRMWYQAIWFILMKFKGTKKKLLSQCAVLQNFWFKCRAFIKLSIMINDDPFFT